jgi:hypothetical protein
MGNPFVHLELTTSDLDKAKDFYTKMFDWKLQEFKGDGPPYLLIDTGKEPGGGMMAQPMPGVPVAWGMYIAVDDLDAAGAKLQKLGGKILMPRTEVPDMGWFIVASDPQGATFGLWQAKM